MSAVKRRVRLVNPSLQLKLCVIFLALSLISLLLQFTLVYTSIASLSGEGGVLDPWAAAELNGMLWRRLLLAAVVTVPLTFFVGIVVTFRIAGPILRFERHLEAIADGENPGPCNIRKGDEFHGLCALLNQTIDTLRAPAPATTAAASGSCSPSPARATARV